MGQSKSFEFATAFFGALNERATTETHNGKEVRIFRGKIVEAYKSLEISQAHYSEVRRGLLESDCITILQQGARGTVSIVILHKPPTAEEYEARAVEKSRLTKSIDAATLAAQLEDLKRSIGGMNVVDVLHNFETRLQELELLVKQLTHKPATPTHKGR